MFRATVRLFPRPYGPLGERPECDPQRTWKNRSENLMVKYAFSGSVNRNVKKFKNIFAIPRDLGELPRNYVLRMLMRNEPVSTDGLFSFLKEQSDCPIDSQRHLRMVLRIARYQSWVRVEKNQKNNKWYWYIHPTRRNVVRGMLTQEADQNRKYEAALALARSNLATAARAARNEKIDREIEALQTQLVDNTCILRNMDIEGVVSGSNDTPHYLRDNGAIELGWIPDEVSQKEKKSYSKG